MKWIFYILIIVVGALFVGINNYFFYKNEEQQTSMQMEREAEQLHSVLLECDQVSYKCDRIIEAFIQTSSIKGKILLKKNNASIITQNLERYEDERSPVQYSTKFQVGKNNFNLYFEKKVTPSILVSIFKSMTFSVTDWKQASLNFTSYQSFKNFISSVAMPRSRPALW